MANDTRQPSLTVMTLDSWKALWGYLKPTAVNVVSEIPSNTEEVCRKIASGYGRKPLFSLEDHVLLTLMRLQLRQMEHELAYEFGTRRSTVVVNDSSRFCVADILLAIFFADYSAPELCSGSSFF